MTKVLTKHPLGKSGRSVNEEDYTLFANAIVSALRRKERTHTELVNELTKRLNGTFAGNVSWYAMTVKLDLEARGVIARRSSKPQTYRLL
jgi:hypothetical protein